MTSDEPTNKKARLEEHVENQNSNESKQSEPVVSINGQELSNLCNVKFERVLSVRNDSKSIYLLGSIGEEKIVIGFERIALDEQFAQQLLSSTDVDLIRDFANDIYGNYFAHLNDLKLNQIKCTIVHPATEKHILKYSFVPTRILIESEQDYRTITLPYIEQSQFSIDWVYNILEHRQEVERIVLEDSDPDNGFILLPDFKWDTIHAQTLYLIAIVHRRNIKSLRDLNESQLPLLRNIKSKCLAVIKAKWGLEEDQVRVFLHYQPSYYHLHVHFTNIQYNAAIATSTRSHLLDTVIYNLEFNSSYYTHASLPFEVREGTKLHQLFVEHKMSKRNELNDKTDEGEDKEEEEETKEVE